MDHRSIRTCQISVSADDRLPGKDSRVKLGFVIPTVGPAVSSAAGLSAFCRGLEDLGYDTLWVSDRLVTPGGYSSHRARCKPTSPTSTTNLASPPAYSSSKKPPATPNPWGGQAFPRGRIIGPLTPNGVASTSPGVFPIL